MPRATSLGAYHLRRWIGTFAHLDTMVFDTPIFDTGLADELCEHIESFEISHRFGRAVQFKNYLTSVLGRVRSLSQHSLIGRL